MDVHVHVHVRKYTFHTVPSDARYKASVFLFSVNVFASFHKPIHLCINIYLPQVQVCLPPCLHMCKLHEPYTLHLIGIVRIYIYIRIYIDDILTSTGVA